MTAHAVTAHIPTQSTHEDRTYRSQRTAELLSEVGEATDQDNRQQLIEELVVVNLGVAHSIAMRYRNRGISVEDLEQVARLGLVKAAQAFDPARHIVPRPALVRVNP